MNTLCSIIFDLFMLFFFLSKYFFVGIYCGRDPIEFVLCSLLSASYKLEMSIQSLVSYSYSRS